MTSPAPLLPPLDARRTWFESVRDRVVSDPARNRMLTWLAPALVTLLAGVLRLVNLAHPHEIMFDETYYVKDAWSLWQHGYESKWGDDADAQLTDGDDAALFEGLANVPVLAIRGEHSDLLSPETLAEMARRHTRLQTLTVPGQGHAPMLRDPATIARIASFVAEAETLPRVEPLPAPPSAPGPQR